MYSGPARRPAECRGRRGPQGPGEGGKQSRCPTFGLYPALTRLRSVSLHCHPIYYGLSAVLTPAEAPVQATAVCHRAYYTNSSWAPYSCSQTLFPPPLSLNSLVLGLNDVKVPVTPTFASLAQIWPLNVRLVYPTCSESPWGRFTDPQPLQVSPAQFLVLPPPNLRAVDSSFSPHACTPNPVHSSIKLCPKFGHTSGQASTISRLERCSLRTTSIPGPTRWPEESYEDVRSHHS